MSGMVVNEVCHGFYLDSVALMRLSRTVAALDGVDEAALMMGSPANRQIMLDAGLLCEAGQGASGGDLVIAIRARSDAQAEAALRVALDGLGKPTGVVRDGLPALARRPRSIPSARRMMPDANLALISVPGDFAAAEARKALRAGLHVMLFSDNVSIENEVALKLEASAAGLLMMGPDCGTAIINGVALAFANEIPRGHFGVIGASGTGMQEVSCLIGQNEGGISHAIGVGGRDLSEAVGGRMTLAAFDMLAGDAETHHIVLVSKPPSRAVGQRIIERVRSVAKPVTICFIGATEKPDLPSHVALSDTLKSAAMLALRDQGMGLGGDGFDAAAAALALPRVTGRVHGLFAGGTLCAEAQVIFRAAGRKLASNAAIPSVEPFRSQDGLDWLIDLGDDRYTRSRPHPMIDPSIRNDVLAEALSSADTGIILLDMVIGYGAHEDPAGNLCEFLSSQAWRQQDTVLIASVTGTDADRQNRSQQMAKLRQMGVVVAPCNADAAGLALACLGNSVGGA